MEDVIVRYISRIIVPFIQLYGLYVILHGHLSPGGGFSGGAIIAASIILYALSFNLTEGTKKLSHDTSSMLESGGAILFACIGLFSILLGTNFLGNKVAGFPSGVPGNLFSGGTIAIITFGIGLKVASTMITLFFNLIRKDGPVRDDH